MISLSTSSQAFQGAAGGVAMTAATKLLGDSSYVHVTFRAQAGAIDARFAFLQQGGRFHFTYRQRIVNKAISHFFGR